MGPNYAYDAAGWHDFYVCVGGAAAALAGLLFVAMSMRLDAILQNPRPRGRALMSLSTLAFLLGLAIVLLIPGQPHMLLGIELAVAGGLMLLYAALFEHRAMHHLLFMLTGGRVLGNAGSCLVLLSGVGMATGRLGGLYLLPAAVLLLFCMAFVGAWRLMLGLAEGAVRGHVAR